MIVVASTIAPHKLDEGFALKWLENIDAMRASLATQLQVFLAIEVDVRGLDPYEPILPRLSEVGATVWTFGIDKDPLGSGPYEITSGDRFIRICTGRNLAYELAMNEGASHILYLDTDTEPPNDCLPRLLEVDRVLVFGHVPTYGLNGPRLPDLPGDCRSHWSSAGFCLVRREAFRRVRWGWDLDSGLTDDPTYARDIETAGYGLSCDWSPVTRHDVIAQHWPQAIVPLESRPADRQMHRVAFEQSSPSSRSPAKLGESK